VCFAHSVKLADYGLFGGFEGGGEGVDLWDF